MYLNHLPNLISFLRLACVPWFINFIITQEFDSALILFIIMALSDAVDGYLARRFDWTTQLGAYLDPLADKLMLVSAFIFFAYISVLPLYLVVLVVGRDILILLGAVIFQRTGKKLQIKPNMISKVNTFIQILLVLSLIAMNIIIIPDILITILIMATVITTLSSGFLYIVDWGEK